MSDLIDRQAAIYLLEHEIELSNRALDFAELVGTEREKFSWGLGLLESIAEDIKQLPSAEPRWIPVTERLPDKMGTYLVTLDYKEHGTGVMSLWFHNEEIGWDLRVADEVTAWMPLPEPWKGEDDE